MLRGKVGCPNDDCAPVSKIRFNESLKLWARRELTRRAGRRRRFGVLEGIRSSPKTVSMMPEWKLCHKGNGPDLLQVSQSKYFYTRLHFYEVEPSLIVGILRFKCRSKALDASLRSLWYTLRSISTMCRTNSTINNISKRDRGLGAA